MKNTNHIIAVLILLGALSCARMEETGLEQVTFQAIHRDVLPSKTVLQSDGSIFWSPGDEINLFYGPTGSSVLVSTSETETAQTSFAGSLSVLPDNQTEFWAVYPYSASNAFDGSAVTLSLPEVQTGRDSTFASGLFVSLAKSTDYTLQFYNLCGGVKFSVSNQGIQYVTFKGNNSEVLAGQVKVTFDEDGKPQVQEVLEGQTELRINAPEGGFEVGKWYYIVSLPVSLSTGYTMAFYANAAQPIIRSVETPVTIKRSMWGKLPFSDNPVPNNEIWYTSTDGNIVEPFMESAFVDVELISNTYENGMGVMKFNKPLGTINASAFTARHTLETITIPYVADLNGNPFTQCENLRAIYGLSAAEENRFWIVGNELRCIAEAGLSSITIPEGVTKLGSAAFFTCYALAEITLPSSLIHISSSVFGYCTSLTQLTLPESVRLIESNAFYRNNQLKSLTVLRETPPTIAGSDILQNSDNCYIYVPAESVQAYKAAYGWSDYAERIYPIGANPSPTSKYLTFTSEGTTKISLSNEGGNSPVLYYSNDATTWTKWDYNELTFTSDTPLYICGDNPDGVCRNETTYCTFVTAGDFFSVTGDATSLVNKSQSIDVVPPYCFTHLFQDCALIKEGPEIPTTNLGVHCYEYMFYGCTGLEVAPSLPATVLSNSCYEDMFNGCRSLAAAPNLPATALAEHCYKGMFQGCTNMSSAPELPATQLSTSCYQWMFCECTNLINCPELPATSLADDCYFGMFMLCPNITSAPVLPATTMSEGCYHLMFDGCTSLRSAPDLPATALADYCYECMFMGCTALETIQSVLPATSLFNACYHNMFSGCTSLTAAPDLPASDLTNMCYYGMFEGCRKLSSIKCLATNLDAEDCLNNWLQGVSTTGTFVKAANVEWPTGASGIPEGWTVENSDGSAVISPNKYLTFTSEGTTTVSLTNNGGNAPVLYYSNDTQTWFQWDYSELTFKANEPLYICGDNPDGFSFCTALEETSKYSSFSSTGSLFSVSGDVMSLLNKDEDVLSIPSDGCFLGLFGESDNLTTAPTLSATELTKYCYGGMFSGCSSLTDAPELPATKMANSCYMSMFKGCAGLTSTPELPATTLAPSCYIGMFEECGGLVSAPEVLPATALQDSCYFNMFNKCISLKSAPMLPATSLTTHCYDSMFDGCTQLNYVKCLATAINEGYCTFNWLNKVASTGTFVKSPDNHSWTLGADGIPEGWTVENSDGSNIITASKYLTFTSEGGTTISLSNYGNNAPVLYYSFNAISWGLWDYSTLKFDTNNPVYICGDNLDGFSVSSSKYSRFASSGASFHVSGDIMSLIDKDVSITEIPSNYCFYCLFELCDGLKSAPELPAVSLKRSCYQRMFGGCLSLTNAPELPAVTMSVDCYNSMFTTCSNLVVPPALPSTSMAIRCYDSMFKACLSLTNAPELPATALATDCYSHMFSGCISLSSAPELPATSLLSNCYEAMFATCTSLLSAPDLPATTLAVECYKSMFAGCSNLSTAPNLPAEIMYKSCYQSMFEGCSSLINAPTLPATSLAYYCYSNMFSGCTILSIAPVLSASTLSNGCYQGMFSACKDLSYVKCLATDITADGCLEDWFSGVSATGTFVQAANVQWPTGVSGIPEGWTIEYE